MATGSMVRELLSTALCTSWDSCERDLVSQSEVRTAEVQRVESLRARWHPDLRPGEGEARPDVLSVDATQEGGGTLQTGVFLPHEKLGIQNGIHLQAARETSPA